MVRGPAALLGLAGVALAYFLAAPLFPGLGPPDLATIVAAAIGLLLAGGLAAALAPGVLAPFSLAPAVLGSGILVAALNAGHAGAAATPVEALFFACAGVAFAALLDAPALAVALPLFVAAVDVAGVLGGGAGTLLTEDTARRGDPLSLELPAWGGGPSAARTSVAVVVFLAAFAAYGERFGLRRRASAAGMLAGLMAAVALTVLLDARVPALALMAAGFLAVNADRLAGLLRRT